MILFDFVASSNRGRYARFGLGLDIARLGFCPFDRIVKKVKNRHTHTHTCMHTHSSFPSAVFPRVGVGCDDSETCEGFQSMGLSGGFVWLWVSGRFVAVIVEVNVRCMSIVLRE